MKSLYRYLRNTLAYYRPLFNIITLLKSIAFNFYYLPLQKALKLPIWVYKPKLIKLKGKLIIPMDNSQIKSGMVRLGFRGNRCFPSNGFIWSNEGKVIFEGNCQIGNNSAIVTGGGEIVFGKNFLAPSSVKLISYCGITFGERCVLGWDTTIQDTDFHPLFDMKTKKFKKAFGKIKIGDYNWLSQGCLVLHSVSTRPHCIFAARSIITRTSQTKEFALHGGNPLKPLKDGLKLDFEHYMIEDYSE